LGLYPKLVNILLLVLVFNFVFSNSITSAVFLTKSNIITVSSYLYKRFIDFSSDIKIFSLFLMSIPLIYNIYLYVIMTGFKEVVNWSSYQDLVLKIRKIVNANLEEIELKKIILTENLLRELTADIPYITSDQELVTDERRYRSPTDAKPRVKIISAAERSRKLEDFFNDELREKRSYLSSRFKYKEINMINELVYMLFDKYSGLLWSERKVLYKIDKDSEFYECTNYFQFNKNKIYKYKFTDVRVIRKDVLESLEHYEKEVIRHIQNFTSYINEYLFCLIKVSVYSTRLNDILSNEINKDIYDHCAIIFKHATKDYFKILFKLLI
jgi:hypothetical protein